jgi:hypothetical protein
LNHNKGIDKVTEEFIVPKSTLETVVNYLANQPWKEAQPLINMLQQVKPYTEEKKED